LRNEVRLASNQAVEFAVKPGAEPRPDAAESLTRYALPDSEVLGTTRPVGARPHLRGRDRILLDEWGPWDHESPWLRALASGAGQQAWQVFGVKRLAAELRAEGAQLTRESGARDESAVFRVSAGPGVTPYQLELSGEGFRRSVRGTIVAAKWETVFFPWTTDRDPRQNVDGWRQLANGANAVRATLDALDLNYGWRGPKEMKLAPSINDRGPGADHFGMIAQTRLKLAAGRWRFTTLSDDGIRVLASGRPVIENWGWHGPTRDEGVFDQAEGGEVDLVVEHFEIDGYAVLRLDLEPLPAK
jgi:hypothetical protein